MSNISSVRAVQNINSGLFFVLVEEALDGKMTIIHPEGKVLTVPGGLFHPPVMVEPADFEKYFTTLQLKALSKNKVSKQSSGAVKRKSRSKKKIVKLGIAAEWSAPNLTFYKHKIDPLYETQSFKIHIESYGVFVITKEEFNRTFNDVVISSSYWREGSFTYKDFPSKAQQFIQSLS